MDSFPVFRVFFREKEEYVLCKMLKKQAAVQNIAIQLANK